MANLHELDITYKCLKRAVFHKRNKGGVLFRITRVSSKAEFGLILGWQIDTKSKLQTIV